MSLLRDAMITRREQELPMVVENNQWTLGSPMTTSRTGSQSASIATNTDIWQKNAEQKRRNKKQGHVSNAKRKDISPRTAERSR